MSSLLNAAVRVTGAIGVDAGERRIFAWAAATFFLIHAAAVTIANASDTFFLKRIGVSRLPLVFLVSSFVLVLTTGAVVRVAARRPQLTLLAATFFGLAVALLPLWLLALADVRSVFVLLVVVSKQVESIAVLVFWVGTGALLNPRQAKRLYAPIVAGGTLGEIAGSFASATVGRTLGIAALLPVAAVALAAAGGLTRGLAAAVPMRVPEARGRHATRRASAMARFAPLWRESALFRILAAAALLCGMLGPLLYFQFAYAADAATRGTDGELRLLTLYAAFRGWLNVAVLAVQLAGTARLFRRIGVPLAATLSPVVYLIAFCTLSIRFRLGAAVGAMAGATLQDHAVYDPAQQVLATLFPERVRPAATTLIVGPVQRTGAVLGNIVALALIAVGTPTWVAVAGVPIALLWLGATLLLWRIYPTVLLQLADRGRLHTRQAVSLQELVDPGTQRAIAASLVDADPDRVRAACALVMAGPSAGATAALARAAAQAPAATRSMLLESLHRVLDRNGAVPGPQVARELEPLLAEPMRIPGVERARVINAYARLTPDLADNPHALDVVRRFRADPEPAVRLAAEARLRDAGASDAALAELDAAIGAALNGTDLEARHVALDELRAVLLDRKAARADTGDVWAAGLTRLHERLADAHDRPRAAEIVADLAAVDAERVAAVAEAMLAHSTDPDPLVRAAVLRFVGNAHLATELGWVVERLGSEDEAESAAAGEALLAFGSLAAGALLGGLHRGSRATRDAVLPILRDLHLDAESLQRLIAREIDHMRRTVWLQYGLAGDAAARHAVVRTRERLGEHLHTVLILFAALYTEDRFVALGRLLVRTPQGRGRAVLLEALEALLPPDERDRIMPLLDERTGRAARAAAEALRRPLPSYDDAVRQALADSDPLTVALLAIAREPRVATDRATRDTAGIEDDGAEIRMLSSVEIVLHLRGLHLFGSLTMRQLSEIAALVHEEAHAAGTVIVREGDFGECMYLILAGEVQISRAGQYELPAGPGELFGEMSLFDGETRIATVTASSRVRLLRLDRHDLFELMDEQPGIAIGICQTLARHARDTIRRLEEKLSGKR